MHPRLQPPSQVHCTPAHSPHPPFSAVPLHSCAMLTDPSSLATASTAAGSTESPSPSGVQLLRERRPKAGWRGEHAAGDFPGVEMSELGLRCGDWDGSPRRIGVGSGDSWGESRGDQFELRPASGGLTAGSGRATLETRDLPMCHSTSEPTSCPHSNAPGCGARVPGWGSLHATGRPPPPRPFCSRAGWPVPQKAPRASVAAVE
eukprot:scaffold22753_cov108-Isochrysis_galbana.AAC.5